MRRMPGATSPPRVLARAVSGPLGFAALLGRARIESWSTPSGATRPSHLARENVADSGPATISTGALVHICALAMRVEWDALPDGAAALATAGARERARVANEKAIGRQERCIGGASVSHIRPHPYRPANKTGLTAPSVT